MIDWVLKLTPSGTRKYNEYWAHKYPDEPHWVPATTGHEVYLKPETRQMIFGEKR